MASKPMTPNGYQKWSTPDWIFEMLNDEFQFDVDVCAVPETAKCGHYYTPETNGLKQKWTGVCWCNPPYDDKDSWLAKGMESAMNGATVVFLLPNSTETNWWWDYCLKGEIRFIRQRVNFGGISQNGNTSGSAIIVFYPGLPEDRQITKWCDYRQMYYDKYNPKLFEVR